MSTLKYVNISVLDLAFYLTSVTNGFSSARNNIAYTNVLNFVSIVIVTG